jgi:hypothetical protein
MKPKLAKLTTAVSTPKIVAGPSPSVIGKAYWKYMKKVLTEDEVEEAKKDHLHHKYLEKLAKGGCVDNILPSPPSPPNIVAGPSLAVTSRAYWKYMNKVLTEEELEEAKKEHRHEKYVESLAKGGADVNFPDSSSPLSLSKAYWKSMKEGLTEEEFAVKKRKIINLKRCKSRRERVEMYNLTCKGTLVKTGSQKRASSRVLPFEREPSTTSPDYRLDFLPAVVIRQMSKYHIACLQDV